MMLVNGIFRATRTEEKIFGQRRVTEQHRNIQNNLRRHITIPGGRNRCGAVQLIGQRQVKIIVCKVSCNDPIQIIDKFISCMDITQIRKLFFDLGFGGTSIEISDGAHKEPFADTLSQLDSIQLVIVFCNQVKNIAENHCIGKQSAFR